MPASKAKQISMVTIMNITELRRALRAIGISDRVLAIGGRAEYSWCVEPSTDGMWEVFWYERGNKNGLVRLPSESDACYQILGRLAYSQVLAGTVTARQAFNSRPSPGTSQLLVEWAQSAGYAYTSNDHSGATIFWTDPGGETRFYIRRRFDDGFVLTSTQRASNEQFELAAPAVETIERHLVSRFAWGFRSRKRLPRLRLPNDPTEGAAGFDISEKDGDGFCTLTDHAHQVIAVARASATGVPELVALSHLVSHPLADIIASYEHPEGRPLFAV